MKIEVFSWKTISHKDHLEVCLPNIILLSGLIGIWSSMKITLPLPGVIGSPKIFF